MFQNSVEGAQGDDSSEIMESTKTDDTDITPKEKPASNSYDYTYSANRPWYLDANHISRINLEAVGHEAEYRDMILKHLEPVSKLIDSAYSKYISIGGHDYASIEELKKNKLDHQKLQAAARMYHITESAVLSKMGMY